MARSDYRGVFRGLYSSLFDSPEYQALSADARLVLLTARLCKQAGPAVIFRFYPALMATQTGLKLDRVNAAVSELAAAGWVEFEAGILWVKNALRYDPSLRLADRKHVSAVVRALAELPRVAIVLRFCDYYEIARPFEGPSKGLRPLGDTWLSEDRIPNTEYRKENLTKENPTEPPLQGAASSSSSRSSRTRSDDWATAPWGTPAALAHLYNESAPDNVSAVESLSDGRAQKARRLLSQFPERAWWVEVFDEYRSSAFLCGKIPPRPGHAKFKPDFDWLLSRGKDGSENAAKVHDGSYR